MGKIIELDVGYRKKYRTNKKMVQLYFTYYIEFTRNFFMRNTKIKVVRNQLIKVEKSVVFYIQLDEKFSSSN